MISKRDLNLIAAMALAITDAVERGMAELAPERGAALAALSLLRHEPGFRVERLAPIVGLSQPGAVRLIDRLEAQGLVRRRPSTQDRRAIELHLTAKGAVMAEQIASAREKAVLEAVGALPHAQVKALARNAESLLCGLPCDLVGAYRICRLCDEANCAECPVEEGLADRSSGTS